MAGPIHSKGVLILAGFLGQRFAVEQPLSLSATLVFEQSYAGVEGDSASSAELYALLSAIADAPIRQSLAVTGSVNQRGAIQAIGGVNEKIEGFFDVCRDRGLTGQQGVLIPVANVDNLMLRRDVGEAAAAGQFHIYPGSDVDEGIALLTGLPAGEPDEAGEYPADSVNGRIVARLKKLAETQRDFAAPPRPGDGTKADPPAQDEGHGAPDETGALPIVRRILVALDASAYSHAALAAAVTLATRFQSDVEGLFVEDINLLRLAELPFAREFRFGQAGPRPVASEDVQRGLRARAALLRHEVEELTSEHKLRGSFRVARGAVAGEVLAAAREADLLALGRTGHSLARRARFGSTARAAIANAVSAVLLVQPEMEAGPVLVFYDGSAAGARALALAAQLAGEANELRILVWGPDEETAFERR